MGKTLYKWWNITMFNGKNHYKWWTITMFNWKKQAELEAGVASNMGQTWS